jgi:hypothetical protein
MNKNLQPLFEMAQINKKEMNNDLFPYDKYKVEIYGESVNKKPHFHIKHIQEKWDLRFDFEGNFMSVKTEGKGNYNINELENRLRKWFKTKNKTDNLITNYRAAKFSWNMMNYKFNNLII